MNKIELLKEVIEFLKKINISEVYRFSFYAVEQPQINQVNIEVPYSSEIIKHLKNWEYCINWCGFMVFKGRMGNILYQITISDPL